MVDFALRDVFLNLPEYLLSSALRGILNMWKGFGSAHSDDPEVSMTIEELIKNHGYPFETYNVTTYDGYILTLHRIPSGKYGRNGIVRKPVLLQHGIGTNSHIWVLNTPDKNLPYLLADIGYDVWLGNVRGNKFGLKNLYFSTKSKEFWDFSFDEMAKYDLPCIIDKMLAVTGAKDIYYVGHSMGNTIAFALLSSQPKYNKKIKAVMALAPVASVTHSRGIEGVFIPLVNQLQRLITLLATPFQSLPQSSLVETLITTLCSSIVEPCAAVTFMVAGFDQEQFNKTRGPVYLHHAIDVANVQTLIHFGQMYNSNEFCYYDFGREENLEKYGQKTPPIYQLGAITTPVALFWSDNDYLADPRDVLWLEKKLRNVILSYRVKYAKFSHNDFVWAKDIRYLLYDKLLETIRIN